jgi:hypothetical protein
MRGEMKGTKRMESVSVKRLVLWIALLMVSTQSYVYSQSDCELRKSEGDVLVYTCKTPDAKLKSIKASFILETTPSILVGHLLDIEHYSSWQYRMIESQVLKRVSESEIIYRGEVQAPWPVSNRDVVLRLKIKQDTVTRVMNFSIVTVTGIYPEKSGVVRVPRSDGKWVVTPIGNNKLKVEYSFVVDPGGSLPGWLVNLTVAEGPYKTFQTLINRIREGVPVPAARFIRD